MDTMDKTVDAILDENPYTQQDIKDGRLLVFLESATAPHESVMISNRLLRRLVNAAQTGFGR